MEKQRCSTILNIKGIEEIHSCRRLRVESESEVDQVREVRQFDKKKVGNEYTSLIMPIRLSMILLFIALVNLSPRPTHSAKGC